MKLTILTNKGSNFGKELITAISNENIEIDSIVLINQPLPYKYKLFKFVLKRTSLFEAIYFSLKAILSKDKRFDNFDYSKYSNNILETNGTNTKFTYDLLKELRPDVVYLGQTGIVRENILNVPKVGTLNLHPGLLPYYRGIDCSKWAILNKDYDKLGSSLHWVNKGVDTGNIISTFKYDLDKSKRLKIIEEEITSIGLVKSAKMLKKYKIHLPSKKQTKEGKQYYKMSLSKILKVKLNIKNIKNF